MKKSPGVFSYSILILLFFLFSTRFSLVLADGIIKETQRIKLQCGGFYSSIGDGALLPDGFVFVFKESAFGQNPLIIKFNKKGEPVSEYHERGNGPGELNEPDGVYAFGNQIFAGEFYNPVVHVFSNNLKFKRDFRIKSSGKILFVNDMYVGIWSRYYHDNKVYLMTIYNKDTFSLYKYAYPIHKDKIPAFVQYYGNVTPISENRYAGIYASDFQVTIFDHKFERSQPLFKKTPEHVKAHIKWKGSRSVIDTGKIKKWMSTWTIPQSVYYVNSHYIITYQHKGATFQDVIDEKGNIILRERKITWFPRFSDGNYLYRIDVIENENEKDEFFIIKETFVTGKRTEYFRVNNYLIFPGILLAQNILVSNF